jgi:hypothetical protein
MWYHKNVLGQAPYLETSDTKKPSEVTDFKHCPPVAPVAVFIQSFRIFLKATTYDLVHSNL